MEKNLINQAEHENPKNQQVEKNEERVPLTKAMVPPSGS